MVIYRRRATGVAFLRTGSNSARPTPPPGGGHNAYKADTRKPKGHTRLIRSSIRSYSSYSSVRAYRRVIVINVRRSTLSSRK